MVCVVCVWCVCVVCVWCVCVVCVVCVVWTRTFSRVFLSTNAGVCTLYTVYKFEGPVPVHRPLPPVA